MATINVTLTSSSSALYSVDPGVALTVDVDDNSFGYLEVTSGSSSSVQVVEFVRGATVAGDTGLPASIVLVPSDQFDTVSQSSGATF